MNTLSLQGGGCLGKGQATLLADEETRPWCEVFELIGGTSVGAINGAFLAAGLKADKLNQFFDIYAPKIFKENPWQFAISRLFKSAKYSPQVLEDSLKFLLGNISLADCKTNFVATAVEMNTGRNVYFQSYGSTHMDEDEIVFGPDSGLKLWQVCRASSAAQSYFPGYQWNGYTFWDGGSTGCNAPDMLVLTEAQELVKNKLSDNGIRMLSLGAGRMDWKFKQCDMSDPGISTVLKATLEMVYSCGETNEVWQAKSLLGGCHLRINPSLGEGFAIDDASALTLGKIAATWRAQNTSVLKSFIAMA